MFTVYRYHAVFTDSPQPLLRAEAAERDHAIIEQVIADLKNSPPSSLRVRSLGGASIRSATTATTSVRTATRTSSSTYSRRMDSSRASPGTAFQEVG
ncbi:hypothetical protein ACL02T_17695 [Pseudonocardia sp. RS010]|uniref:hypothetical protein n=1 Tax=Pseudonocardia sp. RS010 TaxID=3385979 RepID=UPI0039A34009